MKAFALARATAAPDQLAGRVLCHDVRDAAGKLVARKGDRLDAAAAAAVLSAPVEELHLLEIEPGDLHEEPAGARLSAAAAGEGVEVKGYMGGQWSLAARTRGLLRVRTGPLAQVNALPGISIFTLWDQQPVEPGESVAKAKVTPLAIPESLVAEAERVSAGGVVRVAPFRPTVIGAVTREALEPRQRARFETALQAKVDWFGSRLLPVRYSRPDAHEMAMHLEALLAEGAELLIVAGASALDPLDPVFLGIELAGGHMERHGVPAHPGSLLFAAGLRGHTVLGMPTCGMFSQATTFDLALPRLLAGEPVGNPELAALGHGGLLSQDSAYRFPPYRAAAARGEMPE